MKTRAAIEVRHPYVGEVPAELVVGFEALKIDAEWQWVAVADGRVVAQMLTAPMHGILCILRLTAFADAPRGWAVRLFRAALAEARAAGMIGYVSFLSDQNPQERKLMRIVQYSGGMLLPATGAWGFGSTEVKY
jgi:hypothetical protein